MDLANGHAMFVKLDLTSPFTLVKFPGEHNHTQVYLKGYSLIGFPVTAGLPNSGYYNLTINAMGLNPPAVLRNDYMNGYPLQCKGIATYNNYENPILLATSGTAFRQFLIYLTDENGNTATGQEGLLFMWVK